jgi:hypothetical protein
LSLVEQIIQGATRYLGGLCDSLGRLEALRREFDRYTRGLSDYERAEVLGYITVRIPEFTPASSG